MPNTAQCPVCKLKGVLIIKDRHGNGKLSDHSWVGRPCPGNGKVVKSK